MHQVVKQVLMQLWKQVGAQACKLAVAAPWAPSTSIVDTLQTLVSVTSVTSTQHQRSLSLSVQANMTHGCMLVQQCVAHVKPRHFWLDLELYAPC